MTSFILRVVLMGVSLRYLCCTINLEWPASSDRSLKDERYFKTNIRGYSINIVLEDKIHMELSLWTNEIGWFFQNLLASWIWWTNLLLSFRKIEGVHVCDIHHLVFVHTVGGGREAWLEFPALYFTRMACNVPGTTPASLAMSPSSSWVSTYVRRFLSGQSYPIPLKEWSHSHIHTCPWVSITRHQLIRAYLPGWFQCKIFERSVNDTNFKFQWQY